MHLKVYYYSEGFILEAVGVALINGRRGINYHTC